MSNEFNDETLNNDMIDLNKKEDNAGEIESHNFDPIRETISDPVNLSESPFTPLEPVSTPKLDATSEFNSTPIFEHTKKEEKSPIDVLKGQNKLLKGVCVVLILLSLVNIGLHFVNIDKGSTNANILVSDIVERPTVNLTPVKGENKIYTPSEIYANNVNSVVAIQTEIVQMNIFGQMVKGAASGSGFVITDDGYVLTNYHVIEGANTIKVVMYDGTEYSAKLVGSEDENDIAVLKIDSENKFTPVILGDSDKMIVGEDVLAVGNPLGELTFSMTKGIVSALDREIQIDNFTAVNMFQVDCAVNEGNSGGPIFNMYGEVIGVVSAKYASETIEGLGFCIPINDVVNIVTDLIEHDQVIDKAYMGISVTDVNETMINQYSMVRGAYVSVVEENGPADYAGFKIGDIIVGMDGKNIDSVTSLMTLKRNYRAGDTAEFKIWRSGDYMTFKLTFGAYDEEVVNKIQQKNNQQYQYEFETPYGSFDDEMMQEFFNYYYNQR